MKDTPQAMQDVYRKLLMARSGEERLKMGCAMFDAARRLARANLKAQSHSDADIRVRLFLRTYGADFAPDQVERIVQRFAALAGEQRSE